jgi:hypothetical protein
MKNVVAAVLDVDVDAAVVVVADVDVDVDVDAVEMTRNNGFPSQNLGAL